jgi:hypothetical protein
VLPPAGYEPPADLAGYGPAFAYWYEQGEASATDSARFIRENASSDTEAFASAGGLYFDGIGNTIRGGMDLPPVPTRHYLLGLDVALGRGGDATAICVLDGLTGQQVACWASNTTGVEQAAQRVLLLAQRYNTARVCVDATGLGQAMVLALARLCDYFNVQPFTFTKSSKSALWARVRTVLPLLGPLDAGTLQELRSLETTMSGNPAAMAGATDDRAMALALAIQAGGPHWRPAGATVQQSPNRANMQDSSYAGRNGRMNRYGLPPLRGSR